MAMWTLHCLRCKDAYGIPATPPPRLRSEPEFKILSLGDSRTCKSSGSPAPPEGLYALFTVGREKYSAPHSDPLSLWLVNLLC